MIENTVDLPEIDQQRPQIIPGIAQQGSGIVPLQTPDELNQILIQPVSTPELITKGFK